MIVNLLTEHHLEFLSLIGGCRGSSESTLVKMSHCRKSRVTTQLRYHTETIQQKKCKSTLKHCKDIVNIEY